jgi:hypothetical protein
MRRIETEPRFVKGRDSAKWIGMGEPIGPSSHAMRDAMVSQSKYGRLDMARSNWRQEQVIRDITEFVRRVSRHM